MLTLGYLTYGFSINLYISPVLKSKMILSGPRAEIKQFVCCAWDVPVKQTQVYLFFFLLKSRLEISKSVFFLAFLLSQVGNNHLGALVFESESLGRALTVICVVVIRLTS